MFGIYDATIENFYNLSTPASYFYQKVLYLAVFSVPFHIKASNVIDNADEGVFV